MFARGRYILYENDKLSAIIALRTQANNFFKGVVKQPCCEPCFFKYNTRLMKIHKALLDEPVKVINVNSTHVTSIWNNNRVSLIITCTLVSLTHFEEGH